MKLILIVDDKVIMDMSKIESGRQSQRHLPEPGIYLPLQNKGRSSSIFSAAPGTVHPAYRKKNG